MPDVGRGDPKTGLSGHNVSSNFSLRFLVFQERVRAGEWKLEGKNYSQFHAVYIFSVSLSHISFS